MMKKLLIGLSLAIGGAVAVQAHEYTEVITVKHRTCHKHHCHKHHKHRVVKHVYYAHPPCYHAPCCGPHYAPCCGPRIHVAPAFGFGFFFH